MRYFIAVVEKGSFFEAGEACHISQSAVSQQIKALEGELGVLLLERRGRSFSLTPAGQYFYEQAKRQTAAADLLVREVRRIDRGESQRLRVGVLNGFSAAVMQRAIEDFTRLLPHVRLALSTGTHEELFHKVSGGALDLVVNDQWRTLSDTYVNEPLAEQPLYALLRRDLLPCPEGRAEIAEMGERLCILVTAREQYETESEHWRQVMGLESSFLFAANLEEARMNAASGAGFFPCDADMPQEGGACLLPLTRQGTQLSRRMFAFWPKQADSPLQREFTEALRRSLQ